LKQQYKPISIVRELKKQLLQIKRILKSPQEKILEGFLFVEE
jgi:hypothetical protein